MSRAPREFERFVAALHRRLIAVDLLEKSGLGALVGAAAAAAVIPLLAWRGEAALWPTLAALALGATVGFLWSLGNLPTALRAASEADTQLGLWDLLGTALSIRTRPRESDRDVAAAPWLATVLAAADAACAGRAPSDVILRRLNARAWGGIALAAALVVAVAALLGETPRAVARDRGSAAGPALGRPDPLGAAGGTAPAARADSPTAPATLEPTAPARPLMGTTSSPDATAADTAPVPSSTAAQRPGSSVTGTGSGSAASRSPAVPPRVANHGATAADSTATATPDATPAGGSGGSAPSASPAGPAASGRSTSPATAAVTPPWHSPTWRDAARRAGDAVDSGQVPAAHRDLVREYFERP